MTEVMTCGTEPATRPDFASIARHMFKVYDDEGGTYCTTCHRVMDGTPALLERHYQLCERKQPPLAAAARTYTCGPCDVTMDDGGQWTQHFGTHGHWRRYNATISQSVHFQPSHVYRCEYCDVTFYDTEQYIKRHMLTKHEAAYLIDGYQRIMTVVYRARSSNFTGAMHCCTRCDVVRVERLVHDPLHPVCGVGAPLETFFCDTCRLTFIGDEDTYLQHAASPEHLSLAENQRLWHGLTTDERDDWNLPAIVWRHFGGYPHGRGVDVAPCTCDLCDVSVLVAYDGESAVLSHLETCEALPSAAAEQLLPTPPCGKSAADFHAFRCGVCPSAVEDDEEERRPMSDFRAWSQHMTASRHLMTPWEFGAYAYFCCASCRTLYFGPRAHADDESRCVGGAQHQFLPLPVTDLMRFVYRETNADAEREAHKGRSDTTPPSYFYYEQATGHYGRCDRSAKPRAVPFYCITCRLEFYGNRAAFRQHSLTAEHMLLRQYATFELVAVANADLKIKSAPKTTYESVSSADCSQLSSHIALSDETWPESYSDIY